MKIRVILAALVLMVLPVRTEPWGGNVITLSSSTAKRLVTTRTMASTIFFQMDVSSTGLGYVLYAPIGITCAYQGGGTTLLFKLSPGTSTSIGGNGVVPSNSDPQGGLDVAGYCVQGANTSDVMITSWNLRN